MQGLLPGLHFHFDRQKPWFGAHFFRSPIRFACQILEGRLYQNFDFLSSRPDEKLIFDLNVKKIKAVREVGGRCPDGLPPGLQFHFDRQKSWFGQHFVHESPFGRIQGSNAYFQNRYMVDTICMSDFGGTIK